MSAFTAFSKYPALPLVAAAVAALTACGGGDSASTQSAATAASADGMSKIAAVTAASTTDVRDLLPGVATAATLGATSATVAATVGAVRPLGTSATLFIQGVADQPAPAAAITPDPSGRIFYIDANTGNDSNNGRAATAGAAGVGPWRTLGHLMQTDVKAGDTVLLACNSTWRETLRLPTWGTAAHRITVAAAAGCATPPAIDGSQAIPASAWSNHSGNIYKATLTTAPIQLFASAGGFTEAHHPNQGYLVTNPDTPYVSLATDGNVVYTNGVAGSNVLTTGSDLVLPSSARISSGARLRVRTGNWLIDESTISAVNGNQLTLGTATSYPVSAGHGYLLLGQLWMLDSAGEWYYDATAQTLYAWMPDSSAPGAAVSVSVLNTAVDLTRSAFVTIDGVAIRHVGAGVLMRDSTSIWVRNSVIEDVDAIAIDALRSNAANIDSNSFFRIGTEGIYGETAVGMVMRDNLMRDIGAIVQGDQALSVPRNAIAAVSAGTNAWVLRNTIVNTAFTGIRVGSYSHVQDNFVFGACTVLDDGAGINVWASHDVDVRHNTVVHSRGNVSGKPAGSQITQAQGIYLDESTTNTLVFDNTVVDTDNGVQVHVSSNNTISANRLYGNRVSQIWLQETNPADVPLGTLVGNTVTGNQIATIYPFMPGIALKSSLATTAAFATFDNNRYYDRASDTIVSLGTSLGNSTYNFAQWRQSQGVGSTQAVDVHATAVGAGTYAGYNVSSGNLVPNGAVAADSTGWTIWNQTAPAGQLSRAKCAPGNCLSYVAGGSVGLVSSPNFSVVQGQWYRLTVDLATQRPNQRVNIVLRRGGGSGDTAWEWLSDRDLSVTAGQSWGRYSVVFQALKSDTAGNPESGDAGARVDFADIAAGQSVSLANLEVVAITPGTFSQVSGVYINASGNDVSIACPYTSLQPSLCTYKLVNQADNNPITWPFTVPARGALVMYGQDPALIDSDADGIPDSQDSCPGSAAGAQVNAKGCSLAQ